MEAEGKPVRALDEFEPLEKGIQEFFNIYNLLVTGENRISFSDFAVYFQMEEIADYEEQHEVIFWCRKIEGIQAKIRHEKFEKNQQKQKRK